MFNCEMTPIILSQHLNPAEEAARTGIRHGLLHGGKISVHIPINGTTKLKQIQLPEALFHLKDLGSTDHSAWKLVIAWFRHEFSRNPLIIIDHDHPFRELILYANSWCDLQYGLRFQTPIPTVSVLNYALLGNSKINLFTTSDLEDEFRSKYIGPYCLAVSESELLNCLNDHPQSSERSTFQPLLKQMDSDGIPTRLLMVSYFSGPCRSVGVQRLNYWFDEITPLSDGRIETHLATAIDWGEDRENLHFVPDHNIASLLGNENEFPSWGRHFIATEQKNAKSFNTLSHFWRYALEQYFENRDDHFDVVLISGNPFSCFDFAAFAKRRWHARVILDYRDPFANNPRILYNSEQRKMARYTECGYNFQSDMVLTVNNSCLSYFEAPLDINPVVVENGFDERILQNVIIQSLTQGKINFVHAGSFYHDRSPRAILLSIDLEHHNFHHVGGTAGIDDDLMNLPQLVSHGQQTYLDTLGIIGGGDCGVVFLSETAFETTTKVYDYLAMGVDVLICTHGELNQGALSEMLQGQNDIYWCQNTSDGINKFLDSYKPRKKKRRRGSKRYSRRHGTTILVEKIHELIGN